MEEKDLNNEKSCSNCYYFVEFAENMILLQKTNSAVKSQYDGECCRFPQHWYKVRGDWCGEYKSC